MIQLTTARLLIRDHIPDDLQTHHELLSNTKIMWFLQDIMTHNFAESRENLQQAIDQVDLSQRWHDGKLKDRVEYRLLRSEWLQNY